MENTADETSLFCLEIFVDTVDYLQLSTDAKQPEPTDFVFIFAGYPPLVVPAPDTIAQPNAASWVTTRLGKKLTALIAKTKRLTAEVPLV